MKINLQRNSLWMKDFSLQNISSDNVTLTSEDGVSLSIPTSFIVASSEFLGPLLHSHCSSCSNINPVIYLPSVSGLSLKLFSQIICEGETEQLSRDAIQPCLENVGVVLDLLGCKLKLVTKLGCNRAPCQIKVVSTESLAQDVELVKEEFKEMVDVSKNEGIGDQYSKLIVKEEADISITEYSHAERGNYSRPLQEEVLGKSKYDWNQNLKRSAPKSRKENPGKASRMEKVSRIIDKGQVNNSRREFQCSLCDLGFFTSVGLERHTSDKHGENYPYREFKCVECNLSYYAKNSLVKHKREKHNNEYHEDLANTSESTSLFNLVGPFNCTKCDYSCLSSNKFTKHWNQKHAGITHEASFIDTATSITVTLYQVFAFIVRCRLCGIVRCSRTSMKDAILGMKRHLDNNHFDQFVTGNLSDLYSVLQEDNQRREQPLSDATVTANAEIQKIPTIAEFATKTSLCKKGYLGPYQCLSNGCSYVCDKLGLTTQKLLVNHWLADHGDVRSLLYLDISSFTIINVRIICNNIGYCSYIGCDQLMFASRLSNFQMYVFKHWNHSHSSPDDSFNPNMCKTISSKQVPDITEEEAIALVRNSTMHSTSKIGADISAQSITCSIPDCVDNVNLMSYATHFSFKHRELPLNNILVTTNDGRKLSCQDLFKYAIKCSLCTHVSVGASPIRSGLKSMRNHWLREHKDKNIDQMSFTDVMPVSSEQEKDFDNSESSITDKEQMMLEIGSDDNLYGDVVIDEVTTVPVDGSDDEPQSVAFEFKKLKCPLKCSTEFTEQSGLLDHLKTFHRFNNETVKKIIKAHPQLDIAGI